MGSSKNIFSGVIWSVITNIINALYGFIMIPILIKYFGKAEYGLIGLASSVNAYMQLMDMGLTSTNVRFFSNWLAKGDNLRVKKLFSTCTAFYGIVGFINALILLTVYLFSDSIFNVNSEQDVVLKNLLLVLAVSAFVNWFTSCYNQIIQATENVAWTQKRMLLIRLFMLISLGATVLFKLTVLQYFILTVLSNWLVLPWVIKKIREVAPMVSFIPRFDKNIFKEILPYTLNIFSFAIFSFSYKNLQPVFLGMQSTPETVTDYKVVMGIVGIVSSITGIFLTALLPSSSKVIANNDRKKYEQIAYQGTKYLMLFTAFCVFGIVTVSKDLLTLYVGKSFLYLIPWLNLLAINLLTSHILTISSLILGGSNIRPLSKMTAISSTLGLIVTWFLIPYFGVGGVAIATTVYNIGQMCFYYSYYLPKVMNLDSRYLLKKIVFPITLYGGVIVIALSYIPHFNNCLFNVFIFGLSFSILYVLATFLYIDKKDKDYIFGMFKRKKL